MSKQKDTTKAHLILSERPLKRIPYCSQLTNGAVDRRHCSMQGNLPSTQVTTTNGGSTGKETLATNRPGCVTVPGDARPVLWCAVCCLLEINLFLELLRARSLLDDSKRLLSIPLYLHALLSLTLLPLFTAARIAW